MVELMKIESKDIFKILKSDKNISDKLRKYLIDFIDNKDNCYELYIDLNKFECVNELLILYDSLNLTVCKVWKSI